MASAIGKREVAAVLAAHPPETLAALLEAAGVRPLGASGAEALANRVAGALWWHATSPIGLALRTPELDDIIDQVADRMGVLGALPTGDAWARLRGLTTLLVGLSEARVGVSTEDLRPEHQARLRRAWWPRAGLASGSASAFGTAWASRGLLRWTSGPIARLIPLIPTIGPWFVAVRKGAGLAAALGGPVGAGMALIALNDALGPDYRALVPLLLGVGALGPAGLEDAVEAPLRRV